MIVRDKHVYISGHAPCRRTPDGTIAGPLGKLSGKELTLEQGGYQAAKLVGLSILGRDLKRAIGDLDRVSAWLRVLGMVNVAPELQSDHRRHKRVQRTHHRAVWTWSVAHIRARPLAWRCCHSIFPSRSRPRSGTGS